MNIIFDQKQLLRLLSDLYTLTGIRANILDDQGRDVCIIADRTPFCKKINAIPEGHARCVACDLQAVQSCAKESRGSYTYRCHAGICEVILPLYREAGRSPLAYLIYGQFLDGSPIEAQWENCRKALDWLAPRTVEDLRSSFFQFRRYTDTELTAYAEILDIVASHIQNEKMILPTEYTDLQRLQIYLDEHYKEKLSLASISEHLHIGRTKLCRLAKELSHGKTLSYLIMQRRIDSAKDLLLKSDQPISSIAEAVGIGDYNYFSKVFHSATGLTPSDFRKKYRHGQ